jgi:thymidylate kinase
MTFCPLKTFALEGPCCAGKTTLSRGLMDELKELVIGHVRDFSDFVGGGRFLPSPEPSSLEEEENSLRIFLDIENKRIAHLVNQKYDLIIIDRSIYTLIAHCSALDKMNGTNYTNLAKSILKKSNIPLWPDIIVYLDICQKTVKQRNREKFHESSIFINSIFNCGIKNYFQELTQERASSILWVDATLSANTVRKNVLTEIKTFILKGK